MGEGEGEGEAEGEGLMPALCVMWVGRAERKNGRKKGRVQQFQE